MTSLEIEQECCRGILEQEAAVKECAMRMVAGGKLERRHGLTRTPPPARQLGLFLSDDIWLSTNAVFYKLELTEADSGAAPAKPNGMACPL